MKTIKDYSNEQLQHGVARCEDRLHGVLPLGLMRTETRVKEALMQYKDELERRGQNQLEFK
ncbi:hypothetical protein D0T84_01015 [Dysgonomonas sp. 521]|uniref:hypothetical protein n=1 Tax=Dysgonomonas sp. 521 TaxID=2302932 RepID=UPI0013D82FAB|nr:hypothetical protein [Dysgonomonas sp. 521]NDV93497.1 hypothetical protein [Dysgonomonas sp. 521]